MTNGVGLYKPSWSRFDPNIASFLSQTLLMPKSAVSKRFVTTEKCKKCHKRCFSLHPNARFWSITENLSEPCSFALNSTLKKFFKCPTCTHSFDATLNSITGGSWCPYCANLRFCPAKKGCLLCRAKSFAIHPKAKCWSRKNTLQEQEVALNSNKKFFFDCDICLHEFMSKPTDVSAGKWCPYCYGNKRRCPPETIEECTFCWPKCFGSHIKATHWSEKNSVKACEVSIRSDQKYIFKCPKCLHEFESSPDKVVSGRWCPYCANKKSCLTEDKQDCSHCLDNSFATHSRVHCWSDQNSHKPWQVSRNCNEKFTFNCGECYHTFSASLNMINGQDTWCSFCSGRHLCPSDRVKDCLICMNRSFASHHRAQFWSPSNDKHPWEVSAHSHEKILFNCEICSKEFDRSPHDIQAGCWCPFCQYKTEALTHGWCLGWDITTIRGISFDWCKSDKTGRCYPFDIFCPGFGVIIEVDGAQHFRNVLNWGDNLEERQTRDIYKMQCALRNGLRVIRVCQEDVWKNQMDWQTRLHQSVCESKQPIIMLSDDPGIYNEHRRLATYIV